MSLSSNAVVGNIALMSLHVFAFSLNLTFGRNCLTSFLGSLIEVHWGRLEAHNLFKPGLSLTQGRMVVSDVFIVAWVGTLIIADWISPVTSPL